MAQSQKGRLFQRSGKPDRGAIGREGLDLDQIDMVLQRYSRPAVQIRPAVKALRLSWVQSTVKLALLGKVQGQECVQADQRGVDFIQLRRFRSDAELVAQMSEDTGQTEYLPMGMAQRRQRIVSS